MKPHGTIPDLFGDTPLLKGGRVDEMAQALRLRHAGLHVRARLAGALRTFFRLMER